MPDPSPGAPSTSHRVRIGVAFTLNGSPITVNVDPAERLLDTLRYRLGMTGTKEGCAEGECGACTVSLDGLPANACLVPTYQVRGRFVDTIECVADDDVRALHERGATQCGACTPGVVMTARWISQHPEVRNHETVRALMAGNLCRCTGYDGIIEGLEHAIDEREDHK